MISFFIPYAPKVRDLGKEPGVPRGKIFTAIDSVIKAGRPSDSNRANSTDLLQFAIDRNPPPGPGMENVLKLLYSTPATGRSSPGPIPVPRVSPLCKLRKSPDPHLRAFFSKTRFAKIFRWKVSPFRFQTKISNFQRKEGSQIIAKFYHI